MIVIVLVSLILLLREILVSTMFRMVHPYITIHSVVKLVYIAPRVMHFSAFITYTPLL